MTREKFLTEVESVLAERFPKVRVARGVEPFTLLLDGFHVPLENLYRQTEAEPANMPKQVEEWLSQLFNATREANLVMPLDEIRDRVLPMVVAERSDAAKSSACQPLIPGLAVAYAVDGKNTITYVSENQRKRWGVSIDEIHSLAMANLVTRSEALNAHAAQDDDGKVTLILFQAGDGYDASRLLLPTLHDRLKPYLGGPFVAAVPNRDILICFRDDPELVTTLKPKIHSDYESQPHQVSDQLVLVTPDGIAPYE
jgi:hypothetical protein